MANEADGTRQFEAGLRRLADAVILAYDEVEPTPPIMDVLRRELGPLLEATRDLLGDATITCTNHEGSEAWRKLAKEFLKW